MALDSKQAHRNTKQSTAARKPYVYALLILAAILLLSAGLLLSFKEVPDSPVLRLEDDRTLVFSEHPLPEYNVETLEDNVTYVLKKVSFEGEDGVLVDALLRLPKTRDSAPGAVILPGATVSKENAQYLAGHLAEMGYASMALDQRNLGVINFDYDYQLFASGKTPLEYKMVSDALLATDILSAQKEVDQSRIIIIGESNGGRIAIITGALHPEIDIIVGISTSGYNTEEQLPPGTPADAQRFYHSIDPDTYLPLTGTKKLVMIHANNDPIIPLRLAKHTYQKAKEPKKFYTVSADTHGYNRQMQPILKKELQQNQ